MDCLWLDKLHTCWFCGKITEAILLQWRLLCCEYWSIDNDMFLRTQAVCGPSGWSCIAQYANTTLCRFSDKCYCPQSKANVFAPLCCCHWFSLSLSLICASFTCLHNKETFSHTHPDKWHYQSHPQRSGVFSRTSLSWMEDVAFV